MKKIFSLFSLLLVIMTMPAFAAIQSAPVAQQPALTRNVQNQPPTQQKKLPAINSDALVNDLAGVLTPNELAKLRETARAICEKHNIGVGVVIIKSLNGYSPSTAARAYLNASGYADRTNGGTILLLAMESHDWYFVTDAKMRRALVDEFASDKIGDAIVTSMRNGDVAEACMGYLNIVDTYTAHYLETGSGYSDTDPPPEERGPLAALGLVTAAFGSFAAKYKLKMSMSNVEPAIGAGAYMEDGSLSLDHVRDEYLYTTVARHRRERSRGTSSVGGGGGSTGGGGGGKW